MNIAEIATQPTSDPNVKIFHTRFEMSAGPEEGTRGNDAELGAFGQMIMSQVRGISQLHVTPYILMVTKALLYEWEEILPHVEDLLKEFARSQKTLDDFDVDAERVRIQESRVSSARVQDQA